MCLGIPGKVTELSTTNGLPMGTVEFGEAREPNQDLGGGIRKEVCLAYVPDVAVGDYVIVHVGFAITQVDEAEAHRTLAVLREMADLVEGELGQPLPGSVVAR
jgi:hydrogenase expression/formation protein HypC